MLVPNLDSKLDQLVRLANLKTRKQFAAGLGISESAISKWPKPNEYGQNANELPDQQLARIAVLCGFSDASALREFLIPVRTESEPWSHFNEALNLDRTSQWATLCEEVKQERNTVFFVSAETRQYLVCFVAKVHVYLSGRSGIAHRMLNVPYRVRDERPTTADQWEMCFRLAFSDEPGTAAAELRALRTMAPPFLVFSECGIRASELETVGEGLLTFLGERLPHLLQTTTERLQHCPVRLLLPIEFLGDTQARVASAFGRLLCERLEAKEEIHFVSLPELPPVQWPDIESYIETHIPSLSSNRRIELERTFNEFLPSASFLEIATELRRWMT